MNLNGKRIVVTGASSGIGRATAGLLLERGAEVIALDRRDPQSSDMTYVACDLIDAGAIDRAADQIEGPLHGLANVAGVPGSADGETVMRVNLLGPAAPHRAHAAAAWARRQRRQRRVMRRHRLACQSGHTTRRHGGPQF